MPALLPPCDLEFRPCCRPVTWSRRTESGRARPVVRVAAADDTMWSKVIVVALDGSPGPARPGPSGPELSATGTDQVYYSDTTCLPFRSAGGTWVQVMMRDPPSLPDHGACPGGRSGDQTFNAPTGTDCDNHVGVAAHS